MNYNKRAVVNGSGDTPKKGDEVVFSYRMYGYEESKKDQKGDLLHERSNYTAKIGQGILIEGLEKALYEMQIGEEAVVMMSSELAYGILSGELSAKFFKGNPFEDLPLVFDLKLISVTRITAYDS